MRRVIFLLVVLTLFAFCLVEHLHGQTIRERKNLILTWDDFHHQNTHFGTGVEKPGKFSLSMKETHLLKGNVEVDWVRHYYKTPSPGICKPTAIVVDDLGNIFVTGICQGHSLSIPGWDIVTIKYNSHGERLWIAQYDSSLFSLCESSPKAMAVDRQGNVYVTGYLMDFENEPDCITIKYDSNGNLMWQSRYNGPANSSDVSSAIAVDDAGNVYITGYSYDLVTHYDYITIKYNPDGDQVWIARYNGPVNRADLACAVKLDKSGNVYVTGMSNGAGWDYATIKYKSNGEQQWVARYNSGPGDWPDSKDYATCLAVDDSGNVYVSGWSKHSSLKTSSDYATVKYNSSGEEQWIARYNGAGNDDDVPVAIAIDSYGDIYVTGTTIECNGPYRSSDITTIKYDQIGNQKWIVHYNGPGNVDDKATDLKIDHSGNVIVTGSSVGSTSVNTWNFVTISYRLNGKENWAARYNGIENADDEAVALDVDKTGDIFIAGLTNHCKDTQKGDYGIVKYNSSGVIEWTTHYNNGFTTPYINATAFTADNRGNLFLSGSASNNIINFHYNANGEEQWTGCFAGDENNHGYSTAIATDAIGNLYVAGNYRFSKRKPDCILIKYDSYGLEQWVATHNGSADSYDAVSAIAIDFDGYIYITGYSTNLTTGRDYVTIKYSQDGIREWIVFYDFDGNSNDCAYDIAISQSNNVFITGNAATIKYDAYGAVQWINNALAGTKLVLDEKENCYVLTGNDAAKIHFDGEVEWQVTLNSKGRSIARDDSGYIYVTGIGTRQGQGSNIITTKLDSYGNTIWWVEYNGPSNSTDIPVKLELDKKQNIYVAGTSQYDFVTIKYNPAGEEQWVARYDLAGWYDHAIGIAVDEQENVYVSGTCYEMIMYDYNWSIITTIKYTQTPTSIKQEINNHPKEYSLSQNYPNPFNPTTTIRYALPKESFVTLKIFNLLGQEIAALVDELMPMGEHQVQWQAGDLPSGVYLYRLEAYSLGNNNNRRYEDIKKLILLK